MKKVLKSLLSLVLVLGTLLGTSLTANAAWGVEEEYLDDLRLIYADTYEEAQTILSETKLEGYKILNSNLNAASGVVNTLLGNTGVWLAYKTTTDIDNAITDIAIMQMGGGYSIGNYQSMIEQSRKEYEKLGEIYLDAIDYFAEAYDAEDFLAIAAYRQLNFYTGLDKYPEDSLGDLFLDGVLKKSDLATLFFEGNATVAKNVRKLLALGVSYNEDGKDYLAKIGDSAAKMNANPTVFDKKNYKDLAQIIASTILVYKDMFSELSAYEKELNYDDEEFTELEVKYAEAKSLADRMRDVEYLGGKTLYDFCMEYTENTEDYSTLYPLVDALNDGQIAMTKVGHYYDVVRYSMSEAPVEYLDAEISELEKEYASNPIDVFLGVDRTVFKESFAITSAASRADAYTGSTSLGDALFGNGGWVSTSLQIASGGLGVGLAVWAIARCVKGSAKTAAEAAQAAMELGDAARVQGQKAAEQWMASSEYVEYLNELRNTYLERIGNLSDEISTNLSQSDLWNALSYNEKIEALTNAQGIYPDEMFSISEARIAYNEVMEQVTEEAPQKAYNAALRNSRIFTGVLYFLSAAALTYSAISLYNKIYDHYHPTYDEVPTAMVDLVNTPDGDRYIKYDVVYEAQTKEGKEHAGDLNAYKGERWNALYYTKNSEAGNPLLADFTVSTNNNRPEKGYAAVHRFGETVCYDMNKYNFSGDSAVVFMSVAQSDKQKSDVTSIPDIVGSIFGTGLWLFIGTVGATIGIGGTLGVQFILNKKKKDNSDNTVTENN